jgi:hypothetical protein
LRFGLFFFVTIDTARNVASTISGPSPLFVSVPHQWTGGNFSASPANEI